MKYLILIGDGMADYPIRELKGKTPLKTARTPAMDFIARNGISGRVKTIPEGFPPGSDIANLVVMGYDPKRYYTGRAPLEAASMGVELENNDIAFRCNLVTLSDNPPLKMEDFSAGHISTDEAKTIIEEINEKLGSESIKFYPGVSYRHLMVSREDFDKLTTTPPHDITGRTIDPFLPQGKGKERVIHLMEESRIILRKNKLNLKRIRESRKPANSIWLWGQGKRPNIPTFQEKYHLSGSVISAVDLLKGLGIYAGLKVVEVPGATGYLDTNYRGKAEYAIKELKERDLVYVHVEAPDEASHNGDLESKIKAIEEFDEKVVGTVLSGMEEFSDYRIMVLPDHFTPISLKTHSSEPVPFAIFSSNKTVNSQASQRGFDEESTELTGYYLEKGETLMDLLLGDVIN